MTRPEALTAALFAVAAVACSPSLDWREFMADGVGVVASFPCRPDRHMRAVRLDGSTVQMEMLVCTAAGATFALSIVDVADPARVASTLAELRAIAQANVQGEPPQVVGFQVRGMTPNPQAVQLALVGRLPDGASVQLHAAFFSHGLRLYQATVIGAWPPDEAAQTFFAGFRFPP